ncbi:hypothetical protein T484DRAFT_3389049 [Baffinella frigidus]|nr:hypothetical protein T484DRAFT_3389049 [Cryptophyta sp. CCMP2293]
MLLQIPYRRVVWCIACGLFRNRMEVFPTVGSYGVSLVGYSEIPSKSALWTALASDYGLETPGVGHLAAAGVFVKLSISTIPVQIANPFASNVTNLARKSARLASVPAEWGAWIVTNCVSR